MVYNLPIFEKHLIGQKESILSKIEIIPAWNTAGRPKDADSGTIGFNLNTSNLDYWDGSRWLKLPMKKILK